MMLKQLTQMFCREDGQMLAEYLLLLSMLVALVIVTISLYTGPLGSIYADIQQSFEALSGGLTN